jgi:hypothetical protein
MDFCKYFVHKYVVGSQAKFDVSEKYHRPKRLNMHVQPHATSRRNMCRLVKLTSGSWLKEGVCNLSRTAASMHHRSIDVSDLLR